MGSLGVYPQFCGLVFGRLFFAVSRIRGFHFPPPCPAHLPYQNGTPRGSRGHIRPGSLRAWERTLTRLSPLRARKWRSCCRCRGSPVAIGEMFGPECRSVCLRGFRSCQKVPLLQGSEFSQEKSGLHFAKGCSDLSTF